MDFRKVLPVLAATIPVSASPARLSPSVVQTGLAVSNAGASSLVVSTPSSPTSGDLVTITVVVQKPATVSSITNGGGGFKLGRVASGSDVVHNWEVWSGNASGTTTSSYTITTSNNTSIHAGVVEAANVSTCDKSAFNEQSEVTTCISGTTSTTSTPSEVWIVFFGSAASVPPVSYSSPTNGYTVQGSATNGSSPYQSACLLTQVVSATGTAGCDVTASKTLTSVGGVSVTFD